MHWSLNLDVPRPTRWAFAATALSTALLAVSPPLQAHPPQEHEKHGSEPHNQNVDRQDADDNVEWLIDESFLPPNQPILDFDRPIYDSIQHAKEHLHDAYRLDIALQYTLIYQFASGGVSPDDTAVGNFNLTGFQELGPEHDNEDRMGIGFNFEHRSNYGTSGPEFTGAVGTVWAPNDLSSEQYDQLRQLWFGQRFGDGKYAYVVGKLDLGAFLNPSTYAGSTKTLFFSQPFSANPGRVFPGDGLGALVEYKPEEWIYFRGGVADGSATDSNPFDTYDDGDMFYGFEVGFNTNWEGRGKGTYRFTYYDTDTGTGQDNGLATSFDQQVSESLGVFLRTNFNDGDNGAIDTLVATGLSILEPLGREKDSAGVAFAWTEPAAAALDDEYSTELYYRLELMDGVAVSASTQVIFDPSGDPASDVVAIYGLRLNLLY